MPTVFALKVSIKFSTITNQATRNFWKNLRGAGSTARISFAYNSAGELIVSVLVAGSLKLAAAREQHEKNTA